MARRCKRSVLFVRTRPRRSPLKPLLKSVPNPPPKQDIATRLADAGVPSPRARYPPAGDSGPSTSSLPTSNASSNAHSNAPISNSLISGPPASIPPFTPASRPCETTSLQAASVACNSESVLLASLSDSASGSARCQFWTQYEKTASEFDQRFVDRLEKGVDIAMLFAGLFSAVNTAFIIAIQSNIVAFSTSNTAVGSLVSAGGLVVSPTWTAALSYASLSASLLSAFGALLAKQWLAHFKATRSTHGSLPSRGVHRQRKFDVMQSSYFSIILDCVPVLLEISLLLFAFSLLGNTWYPYRHVAGVILVATLIGVTLYFLTFFAALLSPDSPFQTLPSQLTKLCLESLSQLPRLSDCIVRIAPSSHYLKASQSNSNPKIISLSIPTLSQEAPAVRWLLQTSTDPDVVTAVAQMVPEVDWPVDFKLDVFVEPLLETFKSCFEVKRNNIDKPVLSCSNPDQAYACSKALVHLYSELLCGGHGPDEELREDLVSVGWCLSSVEHLQRDPDKFTFICELISLIDRTSRPATLASVPENELSWVSHILPSFLQSKEDQESWTCLADLVIPRVSEREPIVSKVLANYWVTIGLISGMQINADDLVKVDKSSTIDHIRKSVCGFIKPKFQGDTLSILDTTDKYVLASHLIRKVLTVEEERKIIPRGTLSSWSRGQWPSASSKQSSTSTLVAYQNA